MGRTDDSVPCQSVPARDVLQVVSSTDRRGAETFAVDLRHALAKRGRTADVVALEPGRSGNRLDVPVLGRWRFGPPTLLALRREARASGVVVAHGSSTLPASAVATAGTGTPFVYRNIGDPLFWAGTAARRLRVRAGLRRASAVAALSLATADTLMTVLGVPGRKITVIPNGRPAEQFPLVDDGRRTRARRRLGLGEGQVVAYLGALSPEKAVHVAIEAVAGLEGVTLLVAGDGPLRRPLEEMDSGVRFLGAVDRPAEVIAAADVVVLPSLSEGLPGVLIEAGLSGVPVVATRVGGAPDIVVDGETGLLVPPGDPQAMAAAIGQVLDDPRAMGRSAHFHCLQHFSMEVVAEQWDHLLGDVGVTRGPDTGQ
jgi:glycosyltransferase involved in cell wall biosynthesis